MCTNHRVKSQFKYVHSHFLRSVHEPDPDYPLIIAFLFPLLWGKFPPLDLNPWPCFEVGGMSCSWTWKLQLDGLTFSHPLHTVIMLRTGRAEPGLKSGAKLRQWNDLKVSSPVKACERRVSGHLYARNTWKRKQCDDIHKYVGTIPKTTACKGHLS